MVILIKDSANETELKLRMGRNMNQQYKLREVEMVIGKNCGYSKMLLTIEVSPAFKRDFILLSIYYIIIYCYIQGFIHFIPGSAEDFCHQQYSNSATHPTRKSVYILQGRKLHHFMG